jgi:excisionase family DNA binding protein
VKTFAIGIGRRYVTVQEAADYTGLSDKSIRRMLARRALTPYRPVGRLLIDLRQLDALIQASAVGAAHDGE